MSYFASAILASLAAFAAGVAIAFVVHQRRLGRHRGASREDFIEEFAQSSVPPQIASAVYDYYKHRAISKKFSVAPDDDYDHVFSEGDDDIDDDARILMKRLGLGFPQGYAKTRAETPIRTLRDMVLWLHWLHQHQDG